MGNSLTFALFQYLCTSEVFMLMKSWINQSSCFFVQGYTMCCRDLGVSVQAPLQSFSDLRDLQHTSFLLSTESASAVILFHG